MAIDKFIKKLFVCIIMVCKVEYYYYIIFYDMYHKSMNLFYSYTYIIDQVNTKEPSTMYMYA